MQYSEHIASKAIVVIVRRRYTPLDRFVKVAKPKVTEAEDRGTPPSVRPFRLVVTSLPPAS